MLPLIAGGMLLGGLGVATAIPLYALVLAVNLVFVPANQLGKDRADGTLEFLCGLPVQGRELALGLTVAMDEGLLLIGLFAMATALIFLGDTLGPAHLLITAASLFLASALLVTAVAIFVAWLSLRFRPEFITPAVLAVVLGGSLLVGSAGVSIREIWSRFLALEASVASISAGIGVAVVLIGYGGFRLLARAFDRCIRDPALARIRPR